MTIWWVALFGTFFICFIAEKLPCRVIIRGDEKYRANPIFCLIAISGLIVMSAFRSGIGDTNTYKYSYDALSGSIIDFIKSNGITEDNGFNVFQLLLKNYISEDPQTLIIVTSIITIGCIGYRLYIDSSHISYTLFWFIASGSFVTSMNGIRQYMVSAILFLAYPLIIKKKWYIYIPLVLILSTSHSSALLFVPIYFVVNKPAWGNVTKWILIIGVLLFVTYPVSGPIIANLLNETQYGHYGDSLVTSGEGANFIRVVVSAVPVFLAYFSRNISNNRKENYNLLVNMSIINLICILLATRYWIYARFNMYFSLYTFLLMDDCLDDTFSENSRGMVRGLSIVLYAVYFWYEMYISYGGLTYTSILH